MRIEIDASSLLLRSAGVKNYTHHWIRHLRESAPAGSEVRAFPFIGDLGTLNHDGSNLGRFATGWRIGALLASRYVPLIDWTSTISGVAVFHASNQVRRPPGAGSKVALTATVHDLTCWLMPEVHTAANVAADKSFADRVWKRADGLIAVSESTRQDAIRILGVHPDRIRTIYSGIPDRFFEAVPAPRQKPYILFVGTIEPRKNLDTLIDAYEALPVDLRTAYDLVVAGPAGWASDETMARLTSGRIAGVHYTGYVAEADLPGLTAGATVFAYPSLYEGFGFPIAQAMAAGVPVVTSDNSCLPEVAGDGALTVDARSVSALSAALARLLESSKLRERLGAAGRARAMARYRWDVCARDSWSFFKDVAGR